MNLSRVVLLCLLLGGGQAVSPQVRVKIWPASGGAARALQVAPGGDAYIGGLGRAWIARINPSTNEERFRIHLGNDDRDAVNALVLDRDGNAHAGGVIFVNGMERGFTAVLHPDGTTAEFKELPTSVAAIALSEDGDVYAGGDNFVASASGQVAAPPGMVRALAISGGLYAAGRTKAGAGYVARLAEGGDQWDIVFSLDGNSEVRTLAIGSDGSIYVAGVTSSLDFAVRNAFQRRLEGPQDAFLAKLSSDGRGVAWATYLGGRGADAAAAIAADLHGDVLVVGTTTSPDFPLAGLWNGAQDGFFARFDASGRLLESAYVGTSGNDELAAVASDRTGRVWTAGSTDGDSTRRGLHAMLLASPGSTIRLLGGSAALGSPNAGSTASQTTLASTPNPSVYGAAVMLTATVMPSAATGIVTFYDGAVVLGSSAVSAGQAKLNTILLQAGSRSLRAYYAGDATYNVSTSAVQLETVNSKPGSGFAAQVNYFVGQGPFSIAVGDFNGDGKADMAVANYWTNDVSIILGNGNGTFQAPRNFAAAAGPLALAVGDFNRDGIADVAVANYSAGSVSVLLGNGDGTFRPSVPYAAGSGVNSISVADFNGDGKADLVTANFYDNTVSVLLGNGDGTFQAANGTFTGILPTSTAVGDFNGDGKTDLVVTNSGADAGQTGNVSVLIGKGDGTFLPAVTYNAGLNPYSAVVADFDLDGILDLAVANNGDGTVSMLRGLGGGVFANPVSYAAGDGPYAIVSADFNGDGKLDLVVANNSDNSLSVLLAGSAGTFLPAVNYLVGSRPGGLAVGDFNGDGKADLASTNAAYVVDPSDGQYKNSVSVLMALGSLPTAVAVNAGSGQTALINTTFATALQAKVTDSGGSGVAGITVTFTAPFRNASGSFAPGGLTGTALTDASGVASAPPFTANSTAGGYSVVATVGGVSGSASFSMTNSLSAIGTITANPGTTPQSGTINTAFATALAVTVKDAGNNPLSGVNVTFTAPGSGASGVFGNSTATITVATNGSGIAAAPFTANSTAGGPYAVAASSSGLASVNISLTNTVGAASTITANPGTTPQSAAINTAFANALAVTVKDAGNNPVSGVNVTFTAPGSAASGVFSNSTAAMTVVTNASGVASAPFSANGTVGGPYIVTAATGGLSTSFSLTNTAGVPSTMTANPGTTPQSAAINTAFAAALAVTVKDAGNNPLSGVNVTFTAPISGASGIFSNNTATITVATNGSGIATAPYSANGTTGGPYAVTAVTGGLSANFSLTNTVGAPSTMIANPGTTPQSAAINTAFANALAVTVKDAGNNPVSGVNVTFTAPGSVASGVFSNSTATMTVVTNASGVASAPFSANGNVGGPYIVTAVTSGISIGFSLTNTIGAPSTMTANSGTTPQTATINTAFATALAVTVKDAGNNPLSGVNVTFTAPGSGASVIFSNNTVTITISTNVSGVAAAPFTANGTAGGPYAVAASSSGLASVNFSLTNTAGAPSTMTANPGTTPQSVAINTVFANALAVTVKDAGNNPVSGLNVTFTAPASGASGIFGNNTATITVATNASGIAAALFTANGTVGGPYLVTAVTGGLSTGFSLTNTAGAPSAMTANAGTTPQSATISTVFSNPLTVTVRDASNNPLSGVNVSFTAPGSGPSGVFGNNTATMTVATNASGVASAPFTANGLSGGPYTVTAVTGGLSANFSLTNTVGAPSTMTANPGTTPQSVAINTVFANALAVTVKDAGNNPVSGLNVTFTAPASGASGIFGNNTATITVATNASGIAAALFSANGIAGGPYIVTAATSGLSTSFSLTNAVGAPSAMTANAGTTPQSAAINTAFANAVAVTVKDAGNNALSGVNVSFTAPGVGASVLFSNGTATITAATNGSGVASVPLAANSTAGGPYTVTAASTGLTPVNFSLINAVGSASAMTANPGSTPQSATINTAFANALAVIVKDSGNNPVSGVNVAFTAPGNGASGLFSNSSTAITVATNASGVASAPFVANGTAGGQYTVTAASTGLPLVNFSLTNSAGASSTMTVNPGSTPQNAVINTAFANALGVTLRDASSNPAAGVNVTFTAPGSGASGIFGNNFSTITVATNASGVASVPFLANGIAGGPYTVAAASSALSAIFSLANTVGSPSTMTANPGTTPQTATVNTAFSNALAVTVKDAGSNPISGVNVTFTAPGSGASGIFSNGTTAITVAANALGVASAPFTANTTAGGPYTVTAASTGLSGVNFTVANTQGSASVMTANPGATPQSAVVNTTFANALAVTVRDAFNNPISGVNVTFTAPGSGASGLFSNSTTAITVATNASGAVSAPFTANGTAGGPYTLSASATGLTTVIFSLTNTVGVPSTMTANPGTTPQSSAINAAFANALTVTVKDVGNNLLPGVNVTFTAPISGASGLFSNSTTTITVATNGSGIATAPFTANSSVGGPYAVSAASAGLSTSFSLTNSAGAPSTMTANPGTTPQTAAVGTAFANALTVTVKDVGNNLLPGVNLTFTAPISGASGLFSNSTTTITAATNGSGIAIAPFTANGTVGGPYVVIAATGGLSTSFSLTNTAGAPSTMTTNPGTTPQTATVSTPFASALAVTVKDAGNNALPGVNVTFTAPGSGVSGVFSNNTATITVATNASGVASAPLTANSAVGGPYAVSAASAGLSTSFSLTNSAGAPSTITPNSGTTPQTAMVNTAFATALAVTVKDAGNNPLSGVTVTFSAPGSGASAAFLSSPSTVTNASGVASLSVSANGMAGNYLVTAASAGLSTSFALTNTAGAPSTMTANPGTTPQTAMINTAFATALAVTVKDAGNNPLSGVTVTFSAPGSGASAAFLSSPSTVTNASGVASLNVAANDSAGNYQVTAATGGVSTSFSLTNTAGAPSTMTANPGSTPQSAAISAAFANALAVTIKDAGNNPLAGVNVTFTAPGSGASGIFSNGTAAISVTTNGSGIATAPFTANGTAGGPYAVSASSVGLSTIFSLTNTVGAPSTMTANPGSTPQSAAINTAFANALAVTVKDTGNNPVAGVAVTFSAPGSGASATFLSSPSAVTNALGVASLNVVANGTAGSYLVTAGVSGVAAPASFTLTNTAYAISGRITFAGAGKSDVTVTLSGTQSSVTTTDNSGNYIFTGLVSGGYTVTPSVSQYIFTPVSTVIASLTSNIAANFTASIQQGAVRPDKVGTTYSGYSAQDVNGNFAWDGTTTDKLISWSTFQAGEKPIYGDWNGDGKTKVGVYNNGTWLLDYNGNGVWDGPTVDKAIFWSTGLSTDVPVLGDWNGDGKTKIGIYNNGTWILDYNGNGVWEGPGVDKTIYWSTGQAGEVPVVGDWNGDGKTKIGIYANGTWILEYNGNYAWDGTGVDKLIYFGGPGYRPMMGDWNGSGWTKIGAYHVNGTWAIDYNGNFVWDGTSIDKLTFFGGPEWTPVVGDWSGSGSTKIGAYTGGQWALDYDGNFGWDPPIDRLFSFGAPGQMPIVGKW